MNNRQRDKCPDQLVEHDLLGQRLRRLQGRHEVELPLGIGDFDRRSRCHRLLDR
jgi:hypothetical protein